MSIRMENCWSGIQERGEAYYAQLLLGATSFPFSDVYYCTQVDTTEDGIVMRVEHWNNGWAWYIEVDGNGNTRWTIACTPGELCEFVCDGPVKKREVDGKTYEYCEKSKRIPADCLTETWIGGPVNPKKLERARKMLLGGLDSATETIAE